jgi:predicted nucleic-acid-binding Zn-ribbon protein
MEKCPKCSNETVEKGHFNNTVVDNNIRVGYFSETNAKLVNLKRQVTAHVCESCGYTELYTKVK